MGTSFIGAWTQHVGEDWVSFPPDKIDDRELTWNLTSFEPGMEQDIYLRLTLDDVEKGDIIVNCATVTIDGDDQRPEDDKSCVEEMIHEPGANLRVTKHHWWENEDRIQFSIRVENNGTTTLHDVEIIDTYPKDTIFNDEWWHHYWEELNFVHYAAQRKLIWTAGQLNPGDSFDIEFIVNVDGSVVGKQGLAFTNRSSMSSSPLIIL